jgi:hypothetical protein
VSLHGEDDYSCMISELTSDSSYFPPINFTGTVAEKSTGEGVNAIFIYPLPCDTKDGDYYAALRKTIEDIRRFKPAHLLLYTPIYGRGDTDRPVH